MRSLLVVVFIIFLTSCSSKLAYNNLDWRCIGTWTTTSTLKMSKRRSFDVHLQKLVELAQEERAYSL